ncbi:MAG: hypothetical protein GY865_04170 [candidate division Zixibacteria bacterium]|nr:hypothetical protein [candidate division Zixibacteria bacterium]
MKNPNKKNMKFVIGVMQGGGIFIIFLLLHNPLSRLFVETNFSMTILNQISKINGTVFKTIASSGYMLSYDMLILFIIAMLITILCAKLGFILKANIFTSLGMVTGSLIVDFCQFIFFNLSGPLFYFQSLILFSVNNYLSIGIIFSLWMFCYWVVLKSCYFIMSYDQSMRSPGS